MTPSRRNAIGSVLLAATALLPAAAWGWDVQVVGVIPSRSATIVVDGGAPVKIGVGQRVGKIKVLSADRDGAVLVIDGVTERISLGSGREGSSLRVPIEAGSVTLMANSRGQFTTTANVGGQRIRFVIDRRSPITTISRKDADRLKLRYRDQRKISINLPGGAVNGWEVELPSVALGDLAATKVDALVVDGDKAEARLGETFLSQFQVAAQGTTMVLRPLAE